MSNEDETYLQFQECTVNPLGVIGHAIDVGEGFDPALQVACIIQYATVAIHEIDDGR